jgi:hypothetical protein
LHTLRMRTRKFRYWYSPMPTRPTFPVASSNRIVQSLLTRPSRSVCIRFVLDATSGFGPCVPALIRVNITAVSILNLAHGRSTTTDPFMMLRARVATNAAQPNHKKAQVAWAWRQFCSVFAEELQTPLEVVYAWNHIRLEVCDKTRSAWECMTYSVRTAVRTQVGGKRNRRTKAEKHAQRIHGSVDNRDAKLVQERRGDEVQQSDQPP